MGAPYDGCAPAHGVRPVPWGAALPWGAAPDADQTVNGPLPPVPNFPVVAASKSAKT